MPLSENYLTCDLCNYDRHICPGCGDHTPHKRDNISEVCEQCKWEVEQGLR